MWTGPGRDFWTEKERESAGGREEEGEGERGKNLLTSLTLQQHQCQPWSSERNLGLG